MVAVVGGLLLPVYGTGSGGGGVGIWPGALTTASLLLPDPAYAQAADEYLVQTEGALRQLDSHMSRLARRASEVDPMRRCSFQVERRKYNERRDALLRAVRRARAGRPGSVAARREVEAVLRELKDAYSRALACYR
ncbi:MAG: hypothetical protein Kow0092_06630 [Deferrisomatales bacterium]